MKGNIKHYLIIAGVAAGVLFIVGRVPSLEKIFFPNG